MEEPDEQGAAVDDVVKECFAGNIRIVLTGIAGGDAKGEMMFFQQSHSFLHFPIRAFATAGIIGLRKALQGNGGDKILHPQHFLAESFVDEGAVGEGEELAVRVHLAELNEI